MPDIITIIMPYYNNPSMLARHYIEWAAWPEDLRNHFRFIIVDDCSQMPNRAVGVPRPREIAGLISIYWITKDKPWNQHGARNVGAHEALDGWLLLTDMDHMLVQIEAMKLVALRKVERFVYTFARIEANTGLETRNSRGDLKPHPNSFFMTRERYWQIGGYDEDYCGIYGTDSLFRSRCAPMGKLPVYLVRYWRELVADASTNGLPRKEGRDPRAREKVLAHKRAVGREGKIATFLLPWERVV